MIPYVSLLAALLASASFDPQDWPELRGPNQDGALRDVDVFSKPFRLEAAWKKDLGAGYSGLVVAAGRVVGSFSGASEDWVIALDAESGEESWRVPFGPRFPGRQGAEDGPSSTPCVLDGRVFAAGPRGRLVAVDLEQGRELWSVDLVQRFGARVGVYGFGASPIPVGGLVYLSIGTSNGLAGAAFDPASGEVLWEHRGRWVDYQNVLRFVEEGLLLAADEADVTLLDAASGHALLRLPHVLGAPDMSYPQIVPVSAEELLFAYEGEAALRRLDAAQGELQLLWRSRELKQCYSPPVVHDGGVYGLSGTFLVCVDAADGARLWKSREPGARGVILVDGHLVLFSAAGEVVVVAASRAGYDERARLAVAERGGYTAPAFAEGRIFVRNTAGLACVEVVAGAIASPSKSEAAALELPRALAGLIAARGTAAEPEGATGKDAWWDDWWREQEFPLAEGERVHFFYRGEAEDVALVGDMTRDRNVPHALQRVPGTDLFHRAYDYDAEGIWQYYFLVDWERPVLDPRNERTALALSAIHQNPQALGYAVPTQESLLVMPRQKRPSFLDGVEEGGGRLEILPFASRVLRAKRDLILYRPEGHDLGDEALPVLYVLGGDHWFAEGELKPALDALMRRACRPALVVGLPFHVGSADRMGGDDYASAILTEVAPLLAARYGTGAEEVVLGAMDDAVGAMALAALAPERFRRLALLSPAADPEDFDLLEGAEGAPAAVYVAWSEYELHLRDENTDSGAGAARLVEHFRTRECEVVAEIVPQGPGFASWGTRLERVLTFLLPRE